jgi:HEPN domain-containing protein
MSAEQLDNPVFYHQLEELEEEFEQVNLELRKHWTTSAVPKVSR